MARKVIPHIAEIRLKIDNNKDFVVNGGAGSGKTFTLIQSLKYIFEKNPSASVACITYTNVAVNEIKERFPYDNLYVSTIHEFIWNIIKNYKNNLIEAVVSLINTEKQEKGTGIKYSGEGGLTLENYHPEKFLYKEYIKLDKGIVSHNEVLKLGYYLFCEFPLMSRILGDTFDYIFVDEYQDTDKLVVKLLLEEFRNNCSNSVIGFFGDPMQSIYGTGIGDLRKYIDDTKQLQEIKINGNRRCSKFVINILNKIRTDINQLPENRNVMGSAKFLFSRGIVDIDRLKKNKAFKTWDFADVEKTKELYLTHRLIARKQNFDTLLSNYSNNDRILGDSPDRLIAHLLKLQEILYIYRTKKYNEFITKTDYCINFHKDKVDLYDKIEKISLMSNERIGKVVALANEYKLCIIDDDLIQFKKDNQELYDNIMNIPYRELETFFEYRNNQSLYSTQHGVKGAEFNNVLVVLDNGNWNSYNFEQLLGSVKNQNIYNRTHKLFYVCCSRAKKNLVVYCPNFKESMMKKTIEWFGKENIDEIK